MPSYIARVLHAAANRAVAKLKSSVAGFARAATVTSAARAATLTIVTALTGAAPAAHAAHAFSLYDSPKYPPGYTHFAYLNPDAPKGGEIYLANPDSRTSFDKFNPFSMKGVAAAGVSNLMFESLAITSADEIATMYGLLADDMQLAPDRMAMTFHLNPQARFNNGDAVTAEDVKYSFDTLVAKGAPQFKMIYADVKQCVVIDERTIRFDFKSANRELPLIVGGMPVFSRKWAAGTPFDKIQLVPPVASGPYLIERYDLGRSISFKRNPAYWGNELPVRRGAYNFDRIVYRFYKDDVARLEAFMAGEFDVVVEYRAKNWARMYKGPKFDKGEIIKRTLKHSNGAGMQAFVMNLRRPQFQDARVRQALGLALDFEWMNRQLFYGQYVRIDSFSPTASSRPRGRRDPTNSRCSSRCAASCAPRCSGRCRGRPAPRRRTACARTCARPRPCWPRPAGPTATARCATPRARPSPSSSCPTSPRWCASSRRSRSRWRNWASS